MLWLESNGSLWPCTDKLKHFENHFSSLKKKNEEPFIITPSNLKTAKQNNLMTAATWAQGQWYSVCHLTCADPNDSMREYINMAHFVLFRHPTGHDNYNYSSPCHDTKNSLPKHDTKPTFHLSILTLTPRKWLLILKMFDLAENPTPWNLLWTSTSCCLFPPIFVQVISE